MRHLVFLFLCGSLWLGCSPLGNTDSGDSGAAPDASDASVPAPDAGPDAGPSRPDAGAPVDGGSGLLLDGGTVLVGRAGSRLGAHVLTYEMDGQRNTEALDLVRAGPAVVKFVSEWGSAGALPPGSLAIGRKMVIDEFPHEDAQAVRADPKYANDPERAAADFVRAQKQTYQLNPLVRFWEGFNEPVWSTAAEMTWYARFETARVAELRKLGLGAVVGNFATGTPPLHLWPQFLPAVRAARDHGGILGLHEYSCPWLWWMTGPYQESQGNEVDPTNPQRLEGWTTLRYRKVYRLYLEPAGLGNTPLVITEFGIDPLVSPGPPNGEGGTWRELGPYWRSRLNDSTFNYSTGRYPVPAGVAKLTDPADFYLEQLKWMDRELQKDSWVLGATIFTVGSYPGSWRDFDITNAGGLSHSVVPGLIAHLRASRPP